MPLMFAAAALSLAATELRRLPAPAANQGVAADRGHLYAIGNHEIVRLRQKDGREVARWSGDPARFPHLNSCTVTGPTLLCAASNYPAVPMASRVETFDRRSLRHLATRTLPAGIGSLTWVSPHDRGWHACFANYDGKGGERGRDHRATTLVRYDRDWRETGRWLFPKEVLDRLAPRSASGGAWGRDGLLYVTGHDRPELYALRVPPGGGTLELVATIVIPTGGQAIGWDPRRRRILWSVERRTHELVASTIPPVPR